MADKNKKRVQTYLNKEYLKIITLAHNKDQCIEFSKFLSGSDNYVRGLFNSSYNKTQMVVFPRFVSKLDHQATTVAVEAIVIYLEKEEEFKDIKGILYRYGQVPVKVVVADFDATEQADEIDGVYFRKPEDAKELRDYINQLDKQQFIIMKNLFNKYDIDQGGYIDTEELKAIAIEEGFDPKDENFNKSIYCLDLNQDGDINLNEFVMWYKIGRQNTFALPKIYDLYHGTNEFIIKLMEMQTYKEDMLILQDEDNLKKISTQRLFFRSPGIFKLKTFLEASIAIGPIKRQEMALEFLSKFTKNTSSAKANWVSILIPLNQRQKKIDPSKGKFHLDEFKEHCLKWGEEKMGSAFINFFKHLLVFETSYSENSVILAIRMKQDIENLIKNALQPILFIMNNLQTKSNSTWIKLKAHSNLDLYDSLNKDLSFKDFFETSEVIVEGCTFSNQLHTLYTNLLPEYQELYSFIQFFCNPDNVDMELECKIDEIFDSKESFVNYSLKNFGIFLDFIKANVSKELLSAADNFEVAINFFDVFARLKLYTKSTFSENVHIEKII